MASHLECAAFRNVLGEGRGEKKEGEGGRPVGNDTHGIEARSFLFLGGQHF